MPSGMAVEMQGQCITQTGLCVKQIACKELEVKPKSTLSGLDHVLLTLLTNCTKPMCSCEQDGTKQTYSLDQ